jgi:hypothetical protein
MTSDRNTMTYLSLEINIDCMVIEQKVEIKAIA